MKEFQPSQYLVTPAEPLPKLDVLKRTANCPQSMFVYGVKLEGHATEFGRAVVIVTVVAQTVTDALMLLRTALFMEYHYLYEQNKDMNASQVTVVAQADTRSLGRVVILTDGEY